ncbi:PIR Superfamily Protein [Plasmodium ovale curtisi]|uniref:PIR Superfamily Protein n=1 Tax=Plasmodium ovale curtisi TaxID=864141 RepID=A0A1A8XDT5_PLAOA|nr:PIR Superfamily Protein [Plasmodium ovale curtisi]SBT02887.1 PIR Superfamily Protein [Plasmodium ovale curtisi]
MGSDSPDLSNYNQKSWSGVNSGYDVSLLLNYRLYNELSSIYGTNNISDISRAFGGHQLIWAYHDYYKKRNSYHNKCKPDLSIVNHPHWKQRKELYDYYVDYDILSTTAKMFDDKC